MIKTALLVFLTLFFQYAFTQSCPPNIDFENGDFSNWDCFIGNTSVDATGKNVITLNPSPPTANRHEIISAATAEKISMAVSQPFVRMVVIIP